MSVVLLGCNGQRTQGSFDPIGGGDTGNADSSKTITHAVDTLFLPRPVEVVRRTTSALPRGNVRCGLKDKAGDLWFGTWEGIVRYDGRSPNVSGRERFTLFKELDSLSDARGYAEWENIYSIFEDASGHIWFGTPTGVSRYDGNAFTSYTIPEGELGKENVFPGGQNQVLSPVFRTTVLSIAQDKRGALWFGTHGSGAYRYTGTSLHRLSTTDGLCHDVVQDIAEDSIGNLWFGTRGGGVCRYDGLSPDGSGQGRFTGFKADDVVGNHVFFISADKTGAFWIGTVGGGLRRFSGTAFTAVTEPDLRNATCMLEVSSGDRWFSSDGSGAVHYDGRSYTRFTTREGLCSNHVWSVVEDQDHNLWFCTREGLCRYDGRSFTGFAED